MMAATPDNLEEKLNEGIKMPRVDGAMNKLPTVKEGGGKGSNDDEEVLSAKDEAKLLARMRKRYTKCVEYS
jgi:hypothetical protein